jgi:hypothetical protein
VRDLGGYPATTTLAQIMASPNSSTTATAAGGGSGLGGGGLRIAKLAHQEVSLPDGSSVSSYLLQRTSPHRMLLPDHILAMVGDWSGLLVTSATPVPRSVLVCLS